MILSHRKFYHHFLDHFRYFVEDHVVGSVPRRLLGLSHQSPAISWRDTKFSEVIGGGEGLGQSGMDANLYIGEE
jgi:hypothetical protein